MKYHSILSNVPKEDSVIDENWGKVKVSMYRECEDWTTLTEKEFEEYKKPYHATNGWCFVKLIDKEVVENDNQ